MIAIWSEIGTFEITKQRLVDQVRVAKINEWLTEVKLEEIRRKILTPRDGEENQEINDISVVIIRNEDGPLESSETDRYMYVYKLKLQIKNVLKL